MASTNEQSKYLTELTQQTANLKIENFEEYSIPEIISFLKHSHHKFVNEYLPKMEALFLKTLNNCPKNVALNGIFYHFLNYEICLNQHIKIEETQFFNYAELLYKTSIGKSLPMLLFVHFSKYKVVDFSEFHENNECSLQQIIDELNIIKTSKNTSVINPLVQQLYNINEELKTHAWIEDNVLTKRVAEIEAAIKDFIQTATN